MKLLDLVKEITVRKHDINSDIKTVLKYSQPQEGAFIGAFDLCEDFSNWVKEVESVIDNSSDLISFHNVVQFMQDNVKGEIVDASDFDSEEDEENSFIDTIDVERPFKISRIPKDSNIVIPDTKYEYFMILPVDYNRGTNDIGVVFLTALGAKVLNGRLTGNY